MLQPERSNERSGRAEEPEEEGGGRCSRSSRCCYMLLALRRGSSATCLHLDTPAPPRSGQEKEEKTRADGEERTAAEAREDSVRASVCEAEQQCASREWPDERRLRYSQRRPQ